MMMNTAMKQLMMAALLPLLTLLTTGTVMAGIFPPAAGQTNSTAVDADDAGIDAWATGYKDYVPGLEADAEFQTPQKSLGVPGNSDDTNQGVIYDIVSLGRGGSITITFSRPVFNGPDYDFAVFENSFSDDFLEFARVEVSSDGLNFVAFPAFSTVPAPVGGFGSVDTTDVEQVAGKYRGGFGTPFDLQQLAGAANIDLNDIRYVRLTDLVGDGSAVNDLTPASLAHWLGIAEADLPGVLVSIASNAPPAIYDVYPTYDSAGFDLDAVAVLNAGAIPVDVDIDSFDANNEIDPASTANIPVTVFTTKIADGDAIDFDARTINPATLRLGYGEAAIVSGPYNTDFDADGDIDSSYMFQTQDTGIACEDTDMPLVGQTSDSQPLAGVDFVVTTDCETAGCHP
jgi:hypothetical protein